MELLPSRSVCCAPFAWAFPAVVSGSPQVTDSLTEMKGKKATATLPHKKSTTTASIWNIQREGTTAATLPWAGIEGEKKIFWLLGTF
tara:strand:+ start:153 stop:413 length:261 start_codon:yes stop_codon:yes gene_type:complete